MLGVYEEGRCWNRVFRPLWMLASVPMGLFRLPCAVTRADTPIGPLPTDDAHFKWWLFVCNRGLVAAAWRWPRGGRARREVGLWGSVAPDTQGRNRSEASNFTESPWRPQHPIAVTRGRVVIAMVLIEAKALLQSMPPCTVTCAREIAGIQYGHGSAAVWATMRIRQHTLHVS